MSGSLCEAHLCVTEHMSESSQRGIMKGWESNAGKVQGFLSAAFNSPLVYQTSSECWNCSSEMATE